MSENYRVQFDFDPDAMVVMETVKKQINVKTRADVIRYALRILQWTVQQLADGGKIIVEKNGVREQVVFPFLTVAQKSQVATPAAEEAPREAVAVSRG
jgi:exopolyphosphatase/pppGpp-phosphohydrolase